MLFPKGRVGKGVSVVTGAPTRSGGQKWTTMNNNREPMFIITNEDYHPLGAIAIEGGRWIGRSTAGTKIFDRKNYSGAEQATKKLGLFVSSAWYGVRP